MIKQTLSGFSGNNCVWPRRSAKGVHKFLQTGGQTLIFHHALALAVYTAAQVLHN